MNLNEASQKALEIAEERGIHENTMNALKHCAGEVLEAVESYTRYVYSLKEEADNFCDELADIVICVLSISAKENIDIEGAIARKMLINEGRAKNECIK
jgi:NTP pyrophosphatase (non-canonical NTP hydrolase)